MSTITLHLRNAELILKGALNQYSVESALAQSNSLLPTGQSVTVNLHHVTDCDSASLAFLMALLREAKKRNTTLTFIHMPTQMRDLGRISGINPILSVVE